MMDSELLRVYDEMPFPARQDLDFKGMLRHLPKRDFTNVKHGQFASGIDLSKVENVPETALDSLVKSLKEAGITVYAGGIPVNIHIDPAMENEAFRLVVCENAVDMTASGEAGLRYAVYELEDVLLAYDGNGILTADILRIPQVKHRVSRSFFTPISRPPLYLDELEDEMDYYPDEYLDVMAHDRLNGLWITIYLNDMPCSFFPERGKDADRKLAKLRGIIARCARYGIKCYIYMSEPRSFNDSWKNMSKEDRERWPEMAGHVCDDGTAFFCTSSEDGQNYLKETIGYLAENAPGLGGIINIMCCETTWPCATWKLYPHVTTCNCPRCSQHTAGELFADMARLMNDTLHKYQPDAVFIGWFYAANYIPGDPENEIINEIAEAWPEDIFMMRNCETGGRLVQLGREALVQDYSLSYGRASKPWLEMASRLDLPAAKIQTCASHEDATVPYLPVPGELFNIYSDLHANNCQAVMQCWYFGNFPCLMNTGAGRLSFKPFPESEKDFLRELAAPVWGSKAELMAECWKLFSVAYGNFPEVLAFKWFGPLHSSVVFPWYLFPRDLPMAPSYTQRFPRNSGDRIYECTSYVHTPDTVEQLMANMDEGWSSALKKMKEIAESAEQIAQVKIAEAIGLQIRSTRNLFAFYKAREDMIYNRTERLPEMRKLVLDEIECTVRMKELCDENELLGYHAEVESYMFHPAKLEMRAKLLQNLLDTEFSDFDVECEELDKYRGDADSKSDIHVGDEFCVGNMRIKVTMPERGRIVLECCGQFKNLTLYFEPARLCRIISATVSPDKNVRNTEGSGFFAALEDREHARFTIDLDEFADYRHDDLQPVRINISCDDKALSEMHPNPGRLIMGTVNSADLVWLKLK